MEATILFPKYSISLVFTTSTIFIICSFRTSDQPQEGAHSPFLRSKMLTFHFVPAACSQGNESEYHTTILFFFYFYYSTVLSLKANDGCNDLWCTKALLTRGWQWEDGRVCGSVAQMSAWRLMFDMKTLCILIWSWFLYLKIQLTTPLSSIWNVAKREIPTEMKWM